MLLWWDGLTMIEKRIPSNKDTLIRTAEIAFLSQATAGSALSGSSAGASNTKTDSKLSNDRQKSEENQKNKDKS